MQLESEYRPVVRSLLPCRRRCRVTVGMRGERHASRDELAELILRYRDVQARERSRRKQEERGRPRFTSEQRLLILIHLPELIAPHSDPKLTDQVYTHLDIEDLRRAVETVS